MTLETWPRRKPAKVGNASTNKQGHASKCRLGDFTTYLAFSWFRYEYRICIRRMYAREKPFIP